MSALKIVRLLSIAVALIVSFAPEMSHEGLVMVVLGLVGGYLADEANKGNRTNFLVFAVALYMVSGAIGASGPSGVAESAAHEIPKIGEYITGFMVNMSTIVSAAALAVILNALKDQACE